MEADLGGGAYAQVSPDGNSIGAAYWENAAMLWRLWAEGPDPEPALTSIWTRNGPASP